MNISYPFIRRPVGTTLLAIGFLLLGVVAYFNLPVSSLPTIELPTIRVSASRPGADPETMAASVAAPLERRLGAIAGITEMTSVSSLGSTRIIIQFDLSRSIDGAARDVQAALNAAATDLPSDLPSLPSFRKSNPSASPILILALTSKTIPASDLYDVADSVLGQRLSQVEGVAEVSVSGAEQPAIRVRMNPVALASMGLSTEDVRTAIANANAIGPLGSFDSAGRTEAISTGEQLGAASQYDPIVVRSVDGSVVHLSAVASIEQSVRNRRSAAWFNREPSVLLVVTKQAEANVIETVDRIYELLPELKRWLPADVDISVLSDRTGTIRASVAEMQWTLLASIAMVMLVVFLFLRRATPMIAAGVTVPLSLAGTFAAMWAVGYSVDNISLMALAVSVGFVVDDAIVMIENVYRNLEKGHSPLRSAIEGARQIGFTVVSISISLVAAFIPLLFMSGVVGRMFREFSVTLCFSIGVSMLVSLTLTPMICAHFIRTVPSRTATLFDRAVEGVLGAMVAFYGWSLRVVLRYRALVLIVFLATIALTVDFYAKTPKGYFPQDDTGLVYGGTSASTDISFPAMVDLQQKAVDIVLDDPAVAAVGSSVGASGWNASVNRGRLFISLKPLAERDNLTTARVVQRMRMRLSRIPGLRVYLSPARDIRVGGRQSDSSYQFTLYSSDMGELQKWVPKVVDRVKQIPGIVDVSTDREQGGLQANIVIDRVAAARLGVRVQDINNALNNSFSQRQITSIYGPRNQYRVILEVDPRFQRDPSDLTQVHVRGANDKQVPLSAVARVERGIAPLVINHQGSFPAITLTYDIAPDIKLEEASDAILQAVAELHMPDVIRAEFAGEARDFRRNAGSQPLLILAAMVAVYIVLGVLYESLAHPLTIISTLPSAGLGALLALQYFDAELSIIAFIGIILLIGLVKKNGIMMIDFALEGERQRGLSPEQAIYEACLTRFRPILMTTMAAMLGAVPFMIASGPGSELRRPLGMTIIGGLLVSQVLTLYTTPVIYLVLGKLHRRLGGARRSGQGEPALMPAPAPH
jgi:multidrug efflux pump